MTSSIRTYILAILIFSVSGFFHSKKSTNVTTDDHRVLVTVKIYSNLAEIIQPLGKLPLEFSIDDWNDIRSDSVTLIGSDVNITQQTITEKTKSMNNVIVYVRSPSSSSSETKFVKATLIDENRNLVQLIDKDISKEPIYFTASSDHIVYNEEPPQSKYYVNFIYDAKDAVQVSYLRSNLNWKTRYQLNLFDESTSAILMAMADIRNDGKSRINIEHAELLGGDVNLQMYQKQYYAQPASHKHQVAYAEAADFAPGAAPPSVEKGEEVAGLYIFSINQQFSIDAKTNYLLPMFRPRVTVERYGSISKHFYRGGNSHGKAERSYRLSSDRFLSRGNCIIREFDRLVGETTLPDIAAKNKYEFSIGEDADIIYKENSTLISSYPFNTTTSRYGNMQTQTRSTYEIHLLLKNYKTRSVKIEYQQQISGTSVKLLKPELLFTQDGSTVKGMFTLLPDQERSVSYSIEVIN